MGPSFSPFLFAAIRNSFAASWKLAALAETFGGTTGVGVQIRKSFQTFSVADMMAWMMFFVIFVMLHRARGADAVGAARCSGTG